jgi:hypothetical protein
MLRLPGRWWTSLSPARHRSACHDAAKASPRAAYQAICSRGADFGQVGFEPQQVPTTQEPAVYLNFSVPYQIVQVRRSGENRLPDGDVPPLGRRARQQVCPENPRKPATQRGGRFVGEHGSHGNWRRGWDSPPPSYKAKENSRLLRTPHPCVAGTCHSHNWYAGIRFSGTRSNQRNRSRLGPRV